MFRSIHSAVMTRARWSAVRLVTAVTALTLAGATQTAAAAPVAMSGPENGDATVTITGTGEIGTEVTAVVSGVGQPAEFLYRWSVNGIDVVDATGPTYTINGWDGGDLLAVDVTVQRPDVADVVLADDLVVPVTSQLVVSYGYGDTWATNGETLSSPAPGTALPSFYVRAAFVADNGTVYPFEPFTVRAHVSDVGWLPEINASEVAVGSTAPGTELEALRMTNPLGAEGYSTFYRVYSEGFGWLSWSPDDEPSGTVGYGFAIESVQILLLDSTSPRPDPDPIENAPYYDAKLMSYASVTPHVQDLGWTAPVTGGLTAGTVGEGLRLEAVRLDLNHPFHSLGLEGSAHVQDVGWQPYVQSGGRVGTEGQSLRMEALRIRLTGGSARWFHVYYRVHVQNLGWLGWARNGEPAGTSGYGLRLEAVQIYVVSQKEPQPPQVNPPFYAP